MWRGELLRELLNLGVPAGDSKKRAQLHIKVVLTIVG
jgi:hypothetical protein